MNARVVSENNRFFKACKAGVSHAAYKAAKQVSNHAVHFASSEAGEAVVEKIDPQTADIY